MISTRLELHGKLCSVGFLLLVLPATTVAQAGKDAGSPAAFASPWQIVFANAALTIGLDTSRVERLADSTFRVWLQTRWAAPRTGSQKRTPSPFNRELIRTYLRCNPTQYKVVSTVVSLNDGPAIDSVVVGDSAAWAGSWVLAAPQSADAGAGDRACAILRASLTAQAFDSTGMPSLELLAMEAGRASRLQPIRAVERALLCEPSHPLVDSASLAACAVLTSMSRAAAIATAFARGIDAPLGGTAEGDSTVAFPICPTDLNRAGAPRVLVARVTAPVVGVNDKRWEGRLTVELRCRSPDAAGGDEIRILGKEYLYQWSGRAWEMYQHSWLRAGR